MTGDHPIRIFLFGVLNFSLMAAVLSWFLRPAMGQYFFARRARLRKDMLSSVFQLRKARERAAASRARYDGLPKDMAARRAAILAQCREECEAILAEAQRRAAYIEASAARQAEESRAKAQRLVRSQLVTRAFTLAGEGLAAEAAAPALRRYLDAGLAAMPEAVSGKGGA